MAEYIERAALMERFCERCNEEMAETPCEPSDCFAREVIKTITAADVVPVRHGRWNADETCPFCGKKSTEGLDAEKWNYWFPDFCPNCGAKMDGDSDG